MSRNRWPSEIEEHRINSGLERQRVHCTNRPVRPSWGRGASPVRLRRIELSSRNERKSDRRDAELLARLGRVDLELLHPVKLRGKQVRRDVSILRSRAALVETRTKLVNHVRGMAKSLGHRLRSCSARSFHTRVRDEIPAELHPIFDPVLDVIENVTERIKVYEGQIETLCTSDLLMLSEREQKSLERTLLML